MKKLTKVSILMIESDEQMVSDVIKPNNILIHRYNQHFQTSLQLIYEKAEKEMSQWRLYNLTRNASQMTQKQFEDFVHEDGSVEIRFSDDIPLSLI